MSKFYEVKKNNKNLFSIHPTLFQTVEFNYKSDKKSVEHVLLLFMLSAVNQGRVEN